MKETLYALATLPNLSPFNSRPMRLNVPVGEIDVDDGTVFNTSMPPMTVAAKKRFMKMSAVVEPGAPRAKLKRVKRKMQRKNKMLARRRA